MSVSGVLFSVVIVGLLQANAANHSNDVPPYPSVDLTLLKSGTVQSVQEDFSIVVQIENSVTTLSLAGVATKSAQNVNPGLYDTMRRLLLGEQVYVMPEMSIPRSAYFYRHPDNLFVNLEVIRQALAPVSDQDFRHRGLFAAYQARARRLEASSAAPEVATESPVSAEPELMADLRPRAFRSLAPHVEEMLQERALQKRQAVNRRYPGIDRERFMKRDIENGLGGSGLSGRVSPSAVWDPRRKRWVNQSASSLLRELNAEAASRMQELQNIKSEGERERNRLLSLASTYPVVDLAPFVDFEAAGQEQMIEERYRTLCMNTELRVVYVDRDKTRLRYHNEDCRSIKRKEKVPMTLERAKGHEYKYCHSCKPR